MRTLSGIKPTGQPHWGNYFGMIQPAIDMIDGNEAFYFIADYHALTTVRDASELRRDTYEIAAAYLACGLDPERAVVWRQSDVPEVCELTWLLSCVTGFGLIERAHAFKDARAKGKDAGFGLVSYPVLMAADILIFDADGVPVGKDQIQHVEMARDMVGYFNQQFLSTTGHDDNGQWLGKGLKRPEALVRDTTAVVPGVDGQKMSKSYGNTIPIFGSKKARKKAIMSIVTDSKPLEEPKEPEGCHVFALYKLFSTPEEQAALADKYRGGGFGYGHAKLELLTKATEFFAPMQSAFDEHMANTSRLEDILQAGAVKARKTARETMARVYEATGVSPRKVGL